MPRGFRSGITTGVALGAAAALFSPLWQPLLTRWSRPAAKGALKGGLAAYELARTRASEYGEKAQDLLAEAQAERVAEQMNESPSG